MSAPTPLRSATAAAHPNIALIKYWGNADDRLRLPQNGSISMTMGGLHTVTRVRFLADRPGDSFVLQGGPASPEAQHRVTAHLDRIRHRAGLEAGADVVSASDFPSAAGLASSASAFAALTLAAVAAAGLELPARELSRLARHGSGSACRSVFGGFVEWLAGDDAASYAEPLAGRDHWKLVDLVTVVATEAKAVGSSDGHRLAAGSPLQSARVADAPRRLELCRHAIARRDFEALADVTELDCHLMHAVMQTSSPPLLYWTDRSLAVMQAVRRWRAAGSAVCYTLDAGPNVHVLCPQEEASAVAARLEALPGVLRVLAAPPGDGARLIDEDHPLIALL